MAYELLVLHPPQRGPDVVVGHPLAEGFLHGLVEIDELALLEGVYFGRGREHDVLRATKRLGVGAPVLGEDRRPGRMLLDAVAFGSLGDLWAAAASGGLLTGVRDELSFKRLKGRPRIAQPPC